MHDSDDQERLVTRAYASSKFKYILPVYIVSINPAATSLSSWVLFFGSKENREDPGFGYASNF
jgi:hypothetical protein